MFRKYYTLKCTSESQRLCHVSCTDIDNNEFKKYCKANDSSFVEIYSSVDKIKLFNATRLCAKCKHKRCDMIESPNFEYKLSFEKKCLNIGLQMSSKISKVEK